MQYQGRMHQLQRELIGRYYAEATRAAATGEPKVAYLLVSGNPVELLRAMDMLPIYPEINDLQLAVRKESLPYILEAEEFGYSTDNCAYVKADVGIFLRGGKTSYAQIPRPDLIVCNFVGCNVYLHWFEQLAEYYKAPVFNLDVPFVRDATGRPEPGDVAYLVKQLEQLIEIGEKMTGRSFDYQRLQRIVALARDTEDLWSEIKHLNKTSPAPFDGYFDAGTMMAPMYCLRGTEGGLRFFQETYREMAERVQNGVGVLPQEKFRYVIEGPPPWPYYRTFRDLFSKWGAVAVASTYSTVGGTWEWGFRHDPQRPLESIAEHMMLHNVSNRSLLLRYEQIKRYIEEWRADALVIHSIKSCRLFSAGQGDMLDYFSRGLGVPTLLVESDLEDPRYFAEAQMRNRIDAFFETLEHRRLTKRGSGLGEGVKA